MAAFGFFTPNFCALSELRDFRVVLSMAAALVHPGQPWHLGERTLQLQQKTVASSDEMGPRIYHKVRFFSAGSGGRSIGSAWKRVNEQHGQWL